MAEQNKNSYMGVAKNRLLVNKLMNTNTNMGIDLSIDSGVYKPKTRGELADKLREGVSCIVVASNEEFTNICLDGWLDMRGKYKTRPSKIEGWVIYEPIEK